MPEHKPGDGLKSLKTSAAFRIVNFELYTSPNKIVMGLGLIALTGCIGYLMYLRKSYEGQGYYAAVDSQGQETYFVKKKSKWD